MDLNKLIQDESLQLKKLNELVEASVKEEALLSQKLAELEEDTDVSFGQKLADAVAEFGGSWKFIITFLTLMLLWIFTNTLWMLDRSFDPYPFILLNLILSCIAALQVPIIMMSQNRQEDKDRRRARGDYMVNLKAEMEVRSLHKKFDLLIAEQMQHLFKIQQVQMDMLSDLQKNLNKLVNNFAIINPVKYTRPVSF